MKRLVSAILAGFLATLAGHSPTSPSVASASPTSAAAPKKRIYSVAVMGDSLSAPASHGGKYLAYLKERCPRSRFDSYAKGGNMVSQMRKRFARDVFGEGGAERPAYSHVIILGGIADIGSNETAKRTDAKIKADLSSMYETAEAHGADVIALTVPPWGGFSMYNPERHRMTMDLNAWIRARPDHVSFAVDIYPLLSCEDPKKLCAAYGWKDKLHWTKEAHDVVGAELYRSVFSDCE